MVLLIVATFWVSYVVLTLTQYYFNISGLVEEIVHDKQQQMVYIQDNQVSQLLGDNTEFVTQNLLRARALHLIDFYILQKGTEVVSLYDNDKKLKGLDADYTVFNEILATENISFRTIKILNYRLTVGTFQNRTKIILRTLDDLKGSILRDIAMVTLFLSLIVYFFLKDIIDLSRILTSRDRKKITNIRSISKEGQVLLQAAGSYEMAQKTLEYENKIYTETLTPAIVHELKLGTPPPYSFMTTMIRVDLNGYTQIFLSKKEEYVAEIMNTYFTRAREIIERYDGLIYQYVGDEIVFHIKENSSDSQALSLAVLRGIFEIAEEIENSLSADADHHFKVKGSLVLGKIRFASQDTGFSLSGLPLIESARLLSQVDSKSANSVTFYAEAASAVRKLCEIDQTKEVLLKGFAKPSVLCRAKTFTSIAYILKNRKFELATYFRGDNDLISIYTFLTKALQAGKENDFFEIYKVLMSYKIKQTSNKQVQAYTELLKVTADLNNQGKINNKVMASMISLANHVVPPLMVEGDLLSFLEKCLDHQDDRVSANVIIVLGDLAQDIAFLRRYMYSKSNRISADAILVTGKRNFDSELAKKIGEFLDSKNPLFKASGTWVLNQLAEYYKTTDLIFYNTNSDLKKLEQKIKAAS